MAFSAEVTKKFGDAYYGPGAVIGDGKLLEMLMKFFQDFLSGCTLGARRAHAMINGGPIRRRIALNQLQYAAYNYTGGDWDMVDKLVEVGDKLGTTNSVEEFVDFAKG